MTEQSNSKGKGDSDRYRYLLETSRRLTATLGTDELYEAIYRETTALLDATGFYLAVHDQSRDLGRIVFYADEGQTARVDLPFRGSDSEVFRTQRASLITDDLEDGSLLVLGEDGTRVARSAVTAPILLNGRMLGAISAQDYEPDAFDEDDLAFLEGIADVAAVALHNAIQFGELERRRIEAERLEEIGRALTSQLDPDDVLDRVIDAVQEVLSVDGTAIWLCDLGTDSVCRVAVSGGEVQLPVGLEWDLGDELLRSLEDQRRPVVFDNLQTSDLVPGELTEYLPGGSAIGVPVIVSGQVAGILTAGSRQPRRFAREDAGVLQRLANQFAVALGNARLHADVHALSLTDPLTGLPNRRRLHVHLDLEVAAAHRGRPLSIAMVDINRFKHYNDTFGHVAGDTILKAVARVLKDENRAMNLVARYGGDEFVAVLSDTGLEGARNYAERVRRRVETDETLKPFGIELTIGTAEFDADRMASVNDALRAADADMYAAKFNDEQRTVTGP